MPSQRAARRIGRRLCQRAATQIGIRGSCAGGGANSPPHSSTSRSSPSSSSRARSRGSPESPNGANSPWRSPPMPTPSTSRPPLRRSSVTVSRASFAIRRRGVGVTSAPMRTRSVAQAIAVIAIHGSASSRAFS